MLRLRGGAGEEEGYVRLLQEMIMEMAGIMDNVALAHHLESIVNHLTDVRMGYVDSSSVFGMSPDETCADKGPERHAEVSEGTPQEGRLNPQRPHAGKVVLSLKLVDDLHLDHVKEGCCTLNAAEKASVTEFSRAVH